jgi:hypothetical protein
VEDFVAMSSLYKDAEEKIKDDEKDHDPIHDQVYPYIWFEFFI